MSEQLATFFADYSRTAEVTPSIIRKAARLSGMAKRADALTGLECAGCKLVDGVPHAFVVYDVVCHRGNDDAQHSFRLRVVLNDDRFEWTVTGYAVTQASKRTTKLTESALEHWCEYDAFIRRRVDWDLLRTVDGVVDRDVG